MKVSDVHSGQRIDNFLFAQFKIIPKSRIYRAIRQGEIRINRCRIKPTSKIKEGDDIRIPHFFFSEALEYKKTKSISKAAYTAKLSLEILYENDDILIINKPSGVSVHAGGGVLVGLIERLRHQLNLPTLELAHRLDKDTTGCLLLTKKNSALRYYHRLFRESLIYKQYEALLFGESVSDRCLIEAPLLRKLHPNGERFVKVSGMGKASQTQLRVLNASFLSKTGTPITHASLRPLTGRTHQLRVHCAHIHLPILGDEKYGSPDASILAKSLNITSLMLHARTLRFTMPNGENLSVHAPRPKQFSSILSMFF